MLNLLIVIGVVMIVGSALVTLLACMAAARHTAANESWAEEPLSMPEVSAPLPVTQSKRV